MNHSTPFKARPTTYKGIEMRSRLEAGFAAWLDTQRITWEYEPQCFADELGQYLPDFRISEVAVSGSTVKGLDVGGPWKPSHIYVEVKPAVADLDVVRVCRRMEAVWASEPQAVLMMAGPHDLSFWSFPVAVDQKWGVGMWQREPKTLGPVTSARYAMGGVRGGATARLALGAVRRAPHRRLMVQVAETPGADISKAESPWAGQPYWMR